MSHEEDHCELELPEPKRLKLCDVKDDHDATSVSSSTQDWHEKRQALMASIEASLPVGLSKNQRKKQLKVKYREATKEVWRKQQKEKEREKKRKKRLQLVDSEGQNMVIQPKAATCKLMSSDDASKLRVAIELDYDQLMTDQDIKKLMKQCQRCYSTNRRAEKPLQLYLTGFRGKCKHHLDQFIQGYEHWDVNFRERSFSDEFPKEEIIFLTADSPNVLNDLDSSKVYIIGGLVDHNHHKGHCYQQALNAQVEHAQLPITNFVKLNSRKVLAVNHVFEILLSFEQYGNWQKAFYDAVPSRKVQELVCAKKTATSDINEEFVLEQTSSQSTACINSQTAVSSEDSAKII